MLPEREVCFRTAVLSGIENSWDYCVMLPINIAKVALFISLSAASEVHSGPSEYLGHGDLRITFA